MIDIDLSLFAHIQNDSILLGTKDLQGHRFSRTAGYLTEYMNILAQSKSLSPKLAWLHAYISDLVTHDITLISCPSTESLKVFAASFHAKLLDLKSEKPLFLPGGYRGIPGHQMLYQFQKNEDGSLDFIVINSGSGIQYHPKKSTPNKTLYYPTKTWNIPADALKNTELQHFLYALLLPQTQLEKQVTYNSDTLYQKIFPLIAHLDGKEKEFKIQPDYHYTRSQISGTCAQRCLHQLLKINSTSEHEYERFIFKFKLYALEDYIQKMSVPPKAPEIEQVVAAIKNNLKILRTPNLFDPEKIHAYRERLNSLKESLPLVQPPEKIISREQKTALTFVIKNSTATRVLPSNLSARAHQLLLPQPRASMLFDLELTKEIEKIKTVNSPLLRYFYLEKLISKLPPTLNMPQYDLATLELINDNLDEFQSLLQDIRNELIPSASTPVLKHMALYLIKIQEKVRQAVCKIKYDIDDANCSMEIIGRLLDYKQGPETNLIFTATNNPLFDAQSQILFFNKSFMDQIAYLSTLKRILKKRDLSGALHTQLSALWSTTYKPKDSELLHALEEKGFQYLFVLSEIRRQGTASEKKNFASLLQALEEQIDYEVKTKKFVALFSKDVNINPSFNFDSSVRSYIGVVTPLSLHIDQNDLHLYKYNLSSSPPRHALYAYEPHVANTIQLKAGYTGEINSTRHITPNDIVARDYYYLRSNPSLRIINVLDYFNEHIDKLADRNNQLYVEACLFEPREGSLRTHIYSPHFITAFEQYLNKGMQFFATNGKPVAESIHFFRLSFLVTQYSYKIKINSQQSQQYLNKLKANLQNALDSHPSPDIQYALKQYLFLTLISEMEAQDYTPSLLEQVVPLYFELNHKNNPYILEDKAHSVEVLRAMAAFQYIAINHPQQTQKAAEQFFNKPLTGTFPIVHIAGSEETIDLLQGKIFNKDGLHQIQLPLAIETHPLIKQLNLHHIKQCWANQRGTLYILEQDGHVIHLIYDEKQMLTIQREYTINGKKAFYELKPLTPNHLAAQYSSVGNIYADIPTSLQDGSINYWVPVGDLSAKPLLTQNNSPLFRIEKTTISTLDQQYHLISNKAEIVQQLSALEDADFLLTYSDTQQELIKLPRFNLEFCYTPGHAALTFPQTKELVIAIAPFAMPLSGVLLKQPNSETYRLLLPIAQYYEKNTQEKDSNFYELVHDHGVIVSEEKIKQFRNDKSPIPSASWLYQNSMRYMSIQLDSSFEPIVENPAQALYLAYMYLGENKPEKAWAMLETIPTRFGGLLGDPEELRYISWICNSLPYILNEQEAQRYTPPFVACKSKALSLLTDYRLSDKTFTLSKPLTKSDCINSELATQDHLYLENFLNTLEKTIYQHVNDYQKMARNQEHDYQLSFHEKNSLLTYYHKSNQILGALGCIQVTLHLETLLKELTHLQAKKESSHLSSTEENRRLFLEKELQKTQSVRGLSTKLRLKQINLDLSQETELNHSTLRSFHPWNWIAAEHSMKTPERAIKALSLHMNDDEFINNFPIYLAIAKNNIGEDQLRRSLEHFCSKTLIASRHISSEAQSTNIPMLCNILYRIVHSESLKKKLRSQGSYEKQNFSSLVKAAATIATNDLPPLHVYEVDDVYEELLIPQPDKAYQSSNITTVALTPVPSTGHLRSRLGLDSLLERIPLIQQYQELQESHQETMKRLCQDISTCTDEQKIRSIEKMAGQELYQQEQRNKLLAKQLSAAEVPVIRTQISELVVRVNEEQQRAWQQALSLANISQEQASLDFLLERDSGIRPEYLTEVHLRELYIHADLTYTMEKTGLSKAQAQQLHDTIHHAFIKGIEYQCSSKIITALDKKPPDLIQVMDFLTRTDIAGLNNPAIISLQHAEELLLRPRQAQAIEDLLQPDCNGGYAERIEKIIMGGGKSKVILPILAERKAKGDNLVLIEVPQALLATNHEDLNRTSQKLYGKRAHRLEFSRNSDSSPKHLEYLYKLLLEVMTNRDYLVTTAETVQSLELKYLDLLLSTPENVDEWQAKVYWLDQITNLMHQKSDCLIDEVHQSLSIKKRLNYAGGDETAPSAVLIENTLHLFSLIDPDFIRQAPLLEEHYNWAEFQKGLVDKLFEKPSSFLHPFLIRCFRGQNSQEITLIKQAITDYLMGRSQSIPPFIESANNEEKQTLAFFKQQISTLLPQTLTRRLNVNYGATRRPDATAIERALAIPYDANNKPNEQSRFGNNLEAINYTVQMAYIEGISEDYLQEYIAHLQMTAQNALRQNNSPYSCIAETPSAKIWDFILSQIKKDKPKLSHIDVKNKQQLADIYPLLKHNSILIREMLKEHALLQVRHHQHVLYSNPFSHVDLYRSVQGVTGTPSNHPTYHHRLSYDPSSALGTEGYIMELLRQKNTRICSMNAANTSDYVQQIIALNAQTRAIIDVQAAFQGQGNQSIAECISNQHVLFFNQNNILCSKDKDGQIIEIKTTNPKEIERILGCTPGQRFTYYDQAHTIGSDIKQDELAHAAVLVDDKTFWTSFSQGGLRMRELNQQQTIDIIVPHTAKHKNLDDLFENMQRIEQKEQAQENFQAALLQMSGVLRRHCLNIIADIPSEDAKKKQFFAHKFKRLLIETPSEDLFSLYGGILQPQQTKSILEQHKKHLLALSQELELPQSAVIEKQLQGIIIRVMPKCLEHYQILSGQTFTETDAKIEVQIQKQVEVVKEQLVEHYEESYSPLHTEVDVIRLTLLDVLEHHQENNFLPLASLFNTDVSEMNFSPDVYVSPNFYQVYKNQEPSAYIGVYTKPVLNVMYYEDSERRLKAFILTPQEMSHWYFSRFGNENCWIETLQGTPVLGKKPEAASAAYPLLQEQIRFFNGSLKSLLTQETPWVWLKDNPLKKMNFFKSILMPYRPNSVQHVQPLTQALTQDKSKIFIYISERPFENLSNINWEHIDPGCSIVQKRTYERTVEAFAYINQQVMEQDVSSDKIQEQFADLPPLALSITEEHLNKLNQIKEIIKKIMVRHTVLNTKECFLLSEFLHLSLQQLTNETILLLNLHEHPALDHAPTLKVQIEKQLIESIQTPEEFEQIAALNNLHLEHITALMAHIHCPPQFIEDILNKETVDRSLIHSLFEHPEKITTNRQMEQLMRHPLNTSQIRVLVHKIQTPQQVAQLLHHPNMVLECAIPLLEHVHYTGSILQQCVWLTVHDLNCLAQRTWTEDKAGIIFNDIIEHPETDTQVLLSLMAQPFMELNYIEKILKHPKANQEVISDIYDWLFKNQQHQLVLAHFKTNLHCDTKLKKRIERELIQAMATPEDFQAVITLTNLETESLKLLMSNALCTSEFIESLLNKETIKSILIDFLFDHPEKITTDKQIAQLMRHPLNTSQIHVLVHKIQTPQQVAQLLHHSNMVLECAIPLLEHVHYTGSILQQCVWLTVHDLNCLAQRTWTEDKAEIIFNDIIEHPETDTQVLLSLMAQPFMDLNCVQKILKHQEANQDVFSGIYDWLFKNQQHQLVLDHFKTNPHCDTKLKKRIERELILTIKTPKDFQAVITLTNLETESLKLLISNSLCTPEFIERILNTKTIETSLLRFLLERPEKITTNQQIDQILRYPLERQERENLVDIVYEPRHIKILLESPMSFNKAKRLLNHQDYEGALNECTWLTSEHLLELIQNTSNQLENRHLQILAHQNTNNQVKLALIAHPDANLELINAILHHPENNNEVLNDLCLWLLNNKQHSTLIHYLQKNPDFALFLRDKNISNELGLAIILEIKPLNQILWDTLPSQMISVASEKHLNILLHMQDIVFSNDVYNRLAEQVHTEEVIDLLLQNTALPQHIAADLLDKSQCNPKAPPDNLWPWLNNYMIAAKVLEKTADYQTAYAVINKMSADDRNAWINNIKREVPDPENKLDVALHQFKVLTYSHMITAQKSDKYTKVAETAFNLYHTLNKSKTLLDKGQLNTAQFQANGTQAIHNASTVLNTHRGFKRIIMALLNLFTFNAVNRNEWTFFRPDTQSMKLARKMDETLLDEQSYKENMDTNNSKPPGGK